MKDDMTFSASDLAFGEIPICWMQRGCRAEITTLEKDGSINCDLIFIAKGGSSHIEFLWTGQEWSVILSYNVNNLPRFITPRVGRIGIASNKVVWMDHNCYFHGHQAFLEEVEYLHSLRKR